ncbi:endonuclease/exonuclease/phosphatase family protein [Pseudomonas sp. BGr12]|uniref:endonuclease/exonuclease/phosphatase family protein n=1 Tax=Pseudomonas sp. BGr12 TaxID=2936269 RepID=UPI0025596464|nr:endonuclease/exonuclease/phosphatase family protein [Pseudomonas sp. BJa5]MDL2428380.1 endonuclease/exonuclease/phosphatase family protein [Pseudomonas sp. BJa5]
MQLSQLVKILVALLPILLTISPSVLFAETSIASWNTEHLSIRPTKDFQSISKIAKSADILAIQELMSEEALGHLADSLTRETKEHWSYLASHAVGRSSYKEMYGFVWRDSAVRYEDGAVVYLDKHDIFEREPFSARFHSLRDKSDFVVATVHVIYGKGQADRSTEIEALSDYWAWLADVYQGTPRMFLVGDFNTPPSSPAWNSLKQMATPLLTSGASTLSEKDGKFANLYDNIFVSNADPLRNSSAKVINYPKILGISHQQGRKTVSDHAPVIITADLTKPAKSQQIAARPATAPAAKAEKAAKPDKPSSLDPIRGNRKSLAYHKPGCPSYDSISSKNLVEFPNEQAAISSNYHLAGNCRI